MASLFKKERSPFWHIRWKQPDGSWKKESTGQRWDHPTETAKAKEIRATFEASEHRHSSTKHVGWDWVASYFADAALSDLTVLRYNTAWNWISMWLTETGLDVPDVRYAHVAKYMTWRIGKKHKGGKPGARNTAILEVKTLAKVMTEAVRRDLIVASPLAALNLKRTPPKTKRAFTDEEVDQCRKALLAGDEEWMRVSFDIALFTGCRLRETRIPMACIDLDSDLPTITFPHPKGGASESFTVIVPDGLMPLLRELTASGKTHTFDAFPFQPSRRWQQFFKVQKIQDVCFHCLRVTKVTLLRQQDVPREDAMRMVNHSSELVHLKYDRHKVSHLEKYRNSGVAGSAVSISQSPTKTPSLPPPEKTARSKSG